MKSLTFDDVLIVPKYSEIESRDKVDISTNLGAIKLDIPIISAPMDSVTEHLLALEMISLGCGAIIHRYNTPEQQSTELVNTLENRKESIANSFMLGIAIGIKDKDNVERVNLALNKIEKLMQNNKFEKFRRGWDIKSNFVIMIDVAHGDHIGVHKAAKEFKREFPKISLCAGNICTVDAIKRYEDFGIDIAKIGIGPGSCCSTRLTTGCGYPQLEAIQNISDVTTLPIIADGGIKNSGDVVKALAAGANAVMIGSLFASCPESCAKQIQDEKGNKYKVYRGMASYSAKKDNQINDKYVEGESVLKRLSEPVKNIIERLEAGIRSGLSYVGANNISELQSKAEFIEVSIGTQIENSIRP
jgi:IMP dehydrogenase